MIICKLNAPKYLVYRTPSFAPFFGRFHSQIYLRAVMQMFLRIHSVIIDAAEDAHLDNNLLKDSETAVGV